MVVETIGLAKLVPTLFNRRAYS